MKKIKTVRDLRGEVYRILREGIANRTLPPGTRLIETELVEELGVSRTPIREALNQLSKEGMVEIIPRRGTFVKRWSLAEVIEILLLREVLEGLAARLATSRMTEEEIDRLARYMDDYEQGKLDYTEADKRFHEDIVEACGMPRLIELIRNIYDSLQMMDFLSSSFRSKKRIRESVAEHRRVIEALRTGDKDLVERAMRDNFQQTQRYYQRLLEEEAQGPA